MTWKRETVRARFMTRLERALGRCAHCPRHCPATPALQLVGLRTNDDCSPEIEA